MLVRQSLNEFDLDNISRILQHNPNINLTLNVKNVLVYVEINV